MWPLDLLAALAAIYALVGPRWRGALFACCGNAVHQRPSIGGPFSSCRSHSGSGRPAVHHGGDRFCGGREFSTRVQRPLWLSMPGPSALLGTLQASASSRVCQLIGQRASTASPSPLREIAGMAGLPRGSWGRCVRPTRSLVRPRPTVLLGSPGPIDRPGLRLPRGG